MFSWWLHVQNVRWKKNTQKKETQKKELGKSKIETKRQPKPTSVTDSGEPVDMEVCRRCAEPHSESNWPVWILPENPE